ALAKSFRASVNSLNVKSGDAGVPPSAAGTTFSGTGFGGTADLAPPPHADDPTSDSTTAKQTAIRPGPAGTRGHGWPPTWRGEIRAAEPIRLRRSAQPIFAEVQDGPERIIGSGSHARPWMAATLAG